MPDKLYECKYWLTKNALIIPKEQHGSRVDDHEPEIEPFSGQTKMITDGTIC